MNSKKACRDESCNNPACICDDTCSGNCHNYTAKVEWDDINQKIVLQIPYLLFAHSDDKDIKEHGSAAFHQIFKSFKEKMSGLDKN